MIENDEVYIRNQHLFVDNYVLSEEDRNAALVRDPKIWKKYGGSYRCGNCGYMPTFIDIRDWKRCPKCEVLKTFYESEDELLPTFSD